jgi:hypothetical protein
MQKNIPGAVKGKFKNNFENWEGYYVPKITKIEPLKLIDLISSFIKVSLTDSGMTILLFQQKEIQLNHIGNGIFQSSGRINPSHLLYEDDNEKYLTTGIYTLQKINGWKIILVAASLFIGLIGIITVFVAGIYQMITLKLKFSERPGIWAFLGIVLFFISIILIASKNIVFIGDKNFGSILLYFSSVLLPVLVIISFGTYIRRNKSAYKSIGFWGTFFLLQLTILLISFGLVPFSTWQ